MDRTYGTDKWTLRVPVEVKTVGTTTLFIVSESTSGKTHVLSVRGSEVEELPDKVLPSRRT